MRRPGVAFASTALVIVVVSGYLVALSSAAATLPRAATCIDPYDDVEGTLTTTLSGPRKFRGSRFADFTAANLRVSRSTMSLTLKVPEGFALLDSLLTTRPDALVIIGMSVRGNSPSAGTVFTASYSNSATAPQAWEYQIQRGRDVVHRVDDDAVEVTDTTVTVTWPVPARFRPPTHFRWAVSTTASTFRQDGSFEQISMHDDNCPNRTRGSIRATTVAFPNDEATRSGGSESPLPTGSGSTLPSPDEAVARTCGDPAPDSGSGHATAEDAAQALLDAIQTDDREEALQAATPGCVDLLWSNVDVDPGFKDDLVLGACAQMGFPGSSGGGGWWVCTLDQLGYSVASLRVSEGLAADPSYIIDAVALGACDQDWCTGA